MNKTALLLLSVALLVIKPLSAQTVAACQAACATSDQRICAADGQTYPSLCHAQCASKDNYFYFNCAANCESECQKAVTFNKCVMACPREDDKNLLYCGSDGEPYNNICKAQCKNAAIAPVFICNSRYLYSKALCRPKCVRTLGCQQSCKNETSAGYFCANDALIYPTQCEVTCNSLQVGGNAAGNTQADLDQCYNTAMLVFGIISGTVPPPRPSVQ